MAAGYECIGEDCPKPVNWLVTHMNPPGTLAICDDDFPVIVIPVLAQALGVDPGRLYDVIRKHVDREAKAAAKALEAAEAAEAQAAADHQAEPGHESGPPDVPGLEADPANLTDAEYYGGHSR